MNFLDWMSARDVAIGANGFYMARVEGRVDMLRGMLVRMEALPLNSTKIREKYERFAGDFAELKRKALSEDDSERPDGNDLKDQLGALDARAEILVKEMNASVQELVQHLARNFPTHSDGT